MGDVDAAFIAVSDGPSPASLPLHRVRAVLVLYLMRFQEELFGWSGVVVDDS